MSTFDKMVDFFETCRKFQSGIVGCAYGDTGIGKSAAARFVADRHGVKLVTIIASQILPNEVSGITMPVHENKAMEIYDHYRLSSLQDGDILFFDELLEADELVLSACLTLIESRELMSGRKLPDVQIIAATNATIKPNMLKENIRQRFVWRKFEVDPVGTRQHIKLITGLDIGKELAKQLKGTGDEYNILTPRSMTKMAQWIAVSKSLEEAKEIASQINLCWNSALGDQLLECWKNMKRNPKKMLFDKLEDLGVDTGEFEDVSMMELMETLQGLEEWEEIEKALSEMVIDDDEEDKKVDF